MGGGSRSVDGSTFCKSEIASKPLWVGPNGYCLIRSALDAGSTQEFVISTSLRAAGLHLWMAMDEAGLVIGFVITQRRLQTQVAYYEQLGGEGSRTLCLHHPCSSQKCNCIGESDIIGPQKLARVL
jgi:hypothetical protein